MDYIDKSNTSIILGLVSFVGILYMTYNLLLEYKEKTPDSSIQWTDNKIYLFTFLIASLLTFVILVLFKKYLEFKGSKEYLEDKF